MKLKLNFFSFPLLVVSALLCSADTLTWSTYVQDMEDGDTLFVSRHLGPFRDTIQSVINGRIDNDNISDTAEIEQKKIDSTYVSTGDWLYSYTRKLWTWTNNVLGLRNGRGISVFINDTTANSQPFSIISDSTDTIAKFYEDSIVFGAMTINGDLTTVTTGSITTTDLIANGDIQINDNSNIGIDSDTDLMTLHSDSLVISGDLTITDTLSVGGIKGNLFVQDTLIVDGVKGNLFVQDTVLVGDAIKVVDNGSIGIDSDDDLIQLKVDTLGINGMVRTNITDGSSYQRCAAFLGNGTNEVNIYIGNEIAEDSGLVLGYDGTDKFAYLMINGESPEQGLVVANGGNVGVGTLEPEEKLHVYGNAKVEDTIIASSGIKIPVANFGMTLNDGNGSIMYRSAYNPGVVIGFNNGFYFENGSIPIFTGYDSTIVVEFKLGIDTVTPSEKLHVNGNAKIEDTLKVNNYMLLDTGSFACTLTYNDCTPHPLYGANNDTVGRVTWKVLDDIVFGKLDSVNTTIISNDISYINLTRFPDKLIPKMNFASGGLYKEVSIPIASNGIGLVKSSHASLIFHSSADSTAIIGLNDNDTLSLNSVRFTYIK